MTYLNESTRVDLVVSYILHELKKARSLTHIERDKAAATIRRKTGEEFAGLFLRATDPGTLAERFVRAIGATDPWRLFHALSYGWQAKELWNCVGLPQFSWDLRQVSYRQCVIQSPGRWLAEGGLEGDVAVMVALDEAEAITREDPTRLASMIHEEFERKSREARVDDSLIGRQLPDGRILIHDGNGRLQVWIIRVALRQIPRDPDSTVQVWVGVEGGRQVTPEDFQAMQEAIRNLFPAQQLG